MNNRERKTKAIPVIVSPLILSNPKFFSYNSYKNDSPSIVEQSSILYSVFNKPYLGVFSRQKAMKINGIVMTVVAINTG
jgi:hypothetical protein